MEEMELAVPCFHYSLRISLLLFSPLYESRRDIRQRKVTKTKAVMKLPEASFAFCGDTSLKLTHLNLFHTEQPWYFRNLFLPTPSAPLSCSRGDYLDMQAGPCPAKRSLIHINLCLTGIKFARCLNEE